jgi:PAS domain S-box-containing protein
MSEDSTREPIAGVEDGEAKAELHLPVVNDEVTSGALQESVARFERAITLSPYPVMLLADDGEVLLVNRVWEEITGFSIEDTPTISDWTEKAYGIRADNVSDVIGALYSSNRRSEEGEYTVRTAHGELRTWEVFSVPLGPMGDGRNLVMSAAHDVTERRAAELDALEHEQRLQGVVDNAPFGAHMYELTEDGELVLVGYNRTADEILGIDHAELLGLSIEVAFPGLVEDNQIPYEYRRVARDGVIWETDQYSYDDAGIAGVFSVIAFPFGAERMTAFFRDITEKRKVEVELEQSESRYRRLFESMEEAFAYCQIVFDDRGQAVDWVFLDVNAGFARLNGVSDALGKSALEIWPRLRESSPELFDASLRVGTTGQPEDIEVSTASGRWLHLSLSSPEKGFFVAVGQDVTQRKRAEDGLARSARALRALSKVNEALVRAQSEEELLSRVCSAIVDIGGYGLAWVGYAEQDEAKSINPVQSCPVDSEYVKSLEVTWGEGPGVRGPASQSIAKRAPVIVQNLDEDPEYSKWRDVPGAAGFRAAIGLPLLASEGPAFGAVCIYSSERAAFDASEVGLLEEMASDLAFGIETQRSRLLRTEMERDVLRTNARLEGLLKDIVATMGKVVETRDPYTQGHETGVAVLSRQIAEEMGLSADEVDEIEVAALVHDIGKLSVPAEILTKPTRLSEAEFAIIKEHPRTGYDILKDVDFGWPVAEIALQHHERMDRSGYPNGLAGEDIFLAARVVAVADVVEAMASHRPYRPALGLEAAVAEIRDHPEKFDPQVIAALLRVYEAGRIDL